MILPRLAGDRRGAAAVEFALVAPVFLMFIFVMLDGGRMMFNKQALNQLATATARCAAVDATNCPVPSDSHSHSSSDVRDWAVAHTSLKLTYDKVTVTKITTAAAGVCGGQAGVMQAQITLDNPGSALSLLPQAPASFQSTACFPIPT